MSAERDLDLLLPLILHEAAKVVEADRCSLFILDRERNELWSKVAQGAKNEIRLPVGSGIAGSVAADRRRHQHPRRLRGRALQPLVRHLQRLPHADHPLRAHARRQRRGDRRHPGAQQARRPHFDAEDEELLLALGGQAAGAIENALLHEEINRLFEGFVSASVVAIEARDPTTAGHSGRVADAHRGARPGARAR